MNKLDFLKLSKEQVELNPYDGPAKYLNTLRKSNNANEKTIAGNQDTVTSTQDKPKLSTQILGTLKNIAKDPSTYSKLASVASVVAAAEGENTAADALSNISSRIDQNVRSRDTAKATVEAERIAAEAEAEKERLNKEAEQKKVVRLQENVLRKEFTSESKEYRKAIKQKDKLDRSLARATAAGDLSAIFAYMKILDPPSVVREGEQATAKNASGVPDRIRNLYNATIRGTKLTPAQRLDFGETSNQLLIPYIDEYKGLSERYKSIAERQNLNSLNILGADPIESIEQKQTKQKKPKITKQSQEEDIRKNTVDRVTEQQGIQILED